MTDEKICPIMSRPRDEDPIDNQEDLEECILHNFTIIGKIPWSNIFICQKEKCMAWVPECPRYKAQLENDPDYCDVDDCEQRDRDFLECKGGCRLI